MQLLGYKTRTTYNGFELKAQGLYRPTLWQTWSIVTDLVCASCVQEMACAELGLSDQTLQND